MLKQCFRDLRKLVVDLKMDPGSEKGESFEQPFYMRIFALIRLQHQPGGDLRILFRELRAHVAQIRQFAFVIQQEIVTHRCDPLLSDIRRSTDSAPCRR